MNYHSLLISSLYAYATPTDLNVYGPSEIIAPIFFKQNINQIGMFLNGDIISDEDGLIVDKNLVNALRTSMNSNPVRFSIEQKSRRLILLGNTLGCHARDVFEEAVPNSQLTRVFIRSVDTKGISLNV